MKKLWVQSEEKERAVAEKSGVIFSNVDKAPFVQAVQPIYAEIQKNNPELNAIVERIKNVK